MAGVSLGKYFWKRENHSVFVLETFLIIIPPHNDCAVTAKDYSKAFKMITAKKKGEKKKI